MRTRETIARWVMLVVVVVALVANAGRSVEGISPVELPKFIEQVLAQPDYLGSTWGIIVETQNETTGDWTTLYSHNGDEFFQPASNNKILTTAAALTYSGPMSIVETNLFAQLVQPNSSIAEVVCVVGGGDASFSNLTWIVQTLIDWNITKVNTLVIDDTLFPPIPPSWEWEDVGADYGAAPNR
jgi:D-alanyl-D-alanine carboxypeptidase/D-alanyl-D-alanine-endopeptidase (penicillin-binding protein 4)